MGGGPGVALALVSSPGSTTQVCVEKFLHTNQITRNVTNLIVHTTQGFGLSSPDTFLMSGGI